MAVVSQQTAAQRKEESLKGKLKQNRRIKFDYLFSVIFTFFGFKWFTLFFQLFKISIFGIFLLFSQFSLSSFFPLRFLSEKNGNNKALVYT